MAEARSKAELRRDIRAARGSLDPRIRAEEATAMRSHLASRLPVRGLAAYAPMAGEPDLGPALSAAAADGVPIWLPVVTGRGEPLQWARWDPEALALDSTAQAIAGIAEPGGHRLSGAELLGVIELLLVPALALGPDGCRLGQGGGFYDRSIGPRGLAPVCERSPDLPVLGVVRDEEVLPAGALPAAPHDLRVDAALTPSGIIPLRAEL